MKDETLDQYLENSSYLSDVAQGALDTTLESMLMISDEDISPRDIVEERGRRDVEEPLNPEWDDGAYPETPSMAYDMGGTLLSIAPSFFGMSAEYIADRTELRNPSEVVLDYFLTEEDSEYRL